MFNPARVDFSIFLLFSHFFICLSLCSTSGCDFVTQIRFSEEQLGTFFFGWRLLCIEVEGIGIVNNVVV